MVESTVSAGAAAARGRVIMDTEQRRMTEKTASIRPDFRILKLRLLANLSLHNKAGGATSRGF